jgi:hypothetical protein
LGSGCIGGSKENDVMAFARISAVLVFGFGFGVGCSGADEPMPMEEAAPVLDGYSAEETRAMFDAAERAGIERGSIELRSEELLAESDLLLDPETLLELAREHATTSGETPGFRPLGYFSSASTTNGVFTATPPRANAILLTFDTDVPSNWRTALRSAAAQWNPNSCINIAEDGGTDVLSVRVDTTLPPDILAIAFLPFSRGGVMVPGPQIRVNPNTNLSAAALKYAAMHEMGHVLGFMHPGKGKHLPNTSVDTDPSDLTASYSTVMTLSGPNLSSLSTDDVKSRDAVFRKITKTVNGRRVTVCPDGTDKVGF